MMIDGDEHNMRKSGKPALQYRRLMGQRQYLKMILANMINIGVSSRDFGFILNQGGFMLVAAVVSGAGAFACSYFCADLVTKVGRDIRNAVYDASLAFSGGDFEKFGTGSMITRTLNDVNVIQMAISITVQMILPVPFKPSVAVK